MARLLLEDGREFRGKGLGSRGSRFGEIVFNTGMTGYQEIMTDPSYAGQIIIFTYPEIGNYGCNSEDMESRGSFAKGMVMKNYSPVASNYKSQETLDDFLKQHGIIAIHDVDTRAITKHIRNKGAMRAAICSDDTISNSELLKQIRASSVMSGLDLASTVSCKEKFQASSTALGATSINPRYKVIAYDFGIKQNILNQLLAHGCEVEVVPATTPADYILQANPDGVFLSNGPGDPAAVTYAIETVKTLIEKFRKPIFGICLGHQILALACGAKTFKLKFGHRGSNQPIKNLDSTNIEIASHNHGFAVSKENLPDNLEITHLNINDDTVAGIRLKDRPDIFSVQYHPEASPGPHDSDYLFKQFTELMNSNKSK